MSWIKKQAGHVASGAKKMGAGFSETSKGIQTGDLERARKGYGAAIDATPGGELQRSLAKKEAGSVTKDVPTINEIGGAISEASKKALEQMKSVTATNITAADNSKSSGIADALKAAERKERTRLAALEAERINLDDLSEVQAGTVERGVAERIGREGVREVDAGQVGTSEFRGTQASLIKALEAQARGEAPSIAELQAKRAGERALAQQFALSAGATGSEATMARRQAARNQAQIGADIAATSAQARLAEQLQSQQQLGQVAQSARQLDIQKETAQQQADLSAQLANQGVDLEVEKANASAGNAMALANLKTATEEMNAKLQADLANQAGELAILQQNAKAGNEIAIANMNATLTQMGYDDQMARAYMQNELDVSKAKLDTALRQEELAQQTKIAAAQAQAAKEAAVLGSGATLGAAAFKASDITLKKNINISGDRLDDFLDKLQSYDYEYKDKKFGEGMQSSVMAQDLEKSDIGKKAVIDTPEGKMVDYSKLLPEILAATASNHKKLMSLEEALLEKKKKSK